MERTDPSEKQPRTQPKPRRKPPSTLKHDEKHQVELDPITQSNTTGTRVDLKSAAESITKSEHESKPKTTSRSEARPEPKKPKSEQGPSSRPKPQQAPASKKKPAAKFHQHDKQAWLRNSTGAEIAVFKRGELQPDPMTVTCKSTVESLCSYNWRECSAPTLYVPGAPPRWTAQCLPLTLAEDDGGRYIDQNAHRVPPYPFEPLFRAMDIMAPTYDFSQVDCVANRNSLRKLLDFASGRVLEPFRIDLDMVNNTLFITRRERRTRENKKGQMHLGYGHNFEKHFTVAEDELSDSSSHHRATRYRMGDLDCVVRYEVDAWLSQDDSANLGEPGVSVLSPHHESLLPSLQSLTLGTNDGDVSSDRSDKPGTRVVRLGSAVAPDRLLEIKSKARVPKMSDLVPQLWFGRIPYLVVGVHEKGQFHTITLTRTNEEFDKFEARQQDNLRRMVSLIKLLRKETVASIDKACIVVCDPKTKPLRLVVYSSTDKKTVLPTETIEHYWRSVTKVKENS